MSRKADGKNREPDAIHALSRCLAHFAAHPAATAAALEQRDGAEWQALRQCVEALASSVVGAGRSATDAAQIASSMARGCISSTDQQQVFCAAIVEIVAALPDADDTQ